MCRDLVDRYEKTGSKRTNQMLPNINHYYMCSMDRLRLIPQQVYNIIHHHLDYNRTCLKQNVCWIIYIMHKTLIYME